MAVAAAGSLATCALEGTEHKSFVAVAQAESSHPQFVPRYAHRRPGLSVKSGQRIEATPDAIFASTSVFPAGGDPQFLSLPEHLGGGYVFYQAVATDGKSTTNFYRAKTFTGQLEPLVQLPYAVIEVRAGFDRLYALGTGVKVGLDLDTGAVLPLDPLPPVVTIEDLAFVGSRRAAVHAPLVGILTTNDAGLTWHPVPEAEALVDSERPDQIVVRTSHGLQAIGPDRRLIPAQSIESAPATVPVPSKKAGAVSHDEWGTALARALGLGVQVENAIVALDRGQLLIATSRDEFSVRSRRAPIDSSTSCLGVPDGDHAALFLCLGASTTLFRFAKDELRIVRQTRNPQEPKSARPTGQAPRDRLVALGSGAFLLDGPCSSNGPTESKVPKPTPRSTQHSQSTMCWVTEKAVRSVSSSRLLQVPRRYESYAVSKSGVSQIVWDQNSEQFLVAELGTFSTAPNSSQSHLALRKFAIEGRETLLNLLNEGSLLPQASRNARGLSTWVIQGEKFVGVRLTFDGTLDYGAVQRPLSRASFYNEKALLWGAAGFAKQSLDGGLHFEEIAIPYRSADPQLSAPLDASIKVLVGCGAAGCVLGHTLRRGYDATPTPVVKDAPPRNIPPPGGSRHHFMCGAEGTESRPRRREGVSDFEGFWELEAPTLPAGFEGRSVGFPHDLGRLYAFGPKELGWNRDGRFELWFVDPYDVESIKKTRASGHLANTLADAESLLGTLDRASSSTALLLDPDGQRGVLLLRSRGQQTLLSFGQNEPLGSIPLKEANGEEIEVRTLVGVAQSFGQTHLAYLTGRDQINVARLNETGFDLVTQMTFGDIGGRNLALVRSTEGALGLSMDGDTGIFVYPLADDGSLGAPIVAPHQSRRPPACAPEASGFIVERELPLSPYLESEQGQAIKTSGLRAKMILGYAPACLEAMSARVRALSPLPPLSNRDQAVPLSVLNTDSAGGRQVLLCR